MAGLGRHGFGRRARGVVGQRGDWCHSLWHKSGPERQGVPRRRIGKGGGGSVSYPEKWQGDALEPAPEGYAEWFADVKRRVRATSLRAARAVNAEVILLYWSVGNEILDRQERLGWGGKVIPRLAADLVREFPDQKGWSPRNLQYMRAMAEAWRDRPDFVPQVVAQMPWGHVQMCIRDSL